MKIILSAVFSLLCVQTIVPIVMAGNNCPLHDAECFCSDELKTQIKLLIKVAKLLEELTPNELLNIQQPQVIQMLNNEIEQLSQEEQALITPALLGLMHKMHVVQLQEMQCKALHENIW